MYKRNSGQFFFFHRFSEVAELRTTCWLEIIAKLELKSCHQTQHMVLIYLIMKIYNHAYGLNSIPSEMSVEVGKKVCNGMADLHHEHCKKQQMECLFYKNCSEC